MQAETTGSKIPKELQYPYAPEDILRKRQSLRRTLLAQPSFLETRIAILGGSTTAEIKSILELFLLSHGIRPTFYESAYNAYYEEVIFGAEELYNFRPDIVFVHTTWQNVSAYPDVRDTEADIDALVQQEISRFEGFWTKIDDSLGALIIQNNFDLPPLRPLGNLEASAAFGRVNFLMRLNEGFAAHARGRSRLLLNDIHYLCASVGLDQWIDRSYWYNYHMALSPVATVALAQNVAAMVKSVYGKSKKCLVLDLDNTLWGGVIGDDGLQNLILGRDHPAGEAYLDFQRYVKRLAQRGILLAVCSKNEVENAKEGFTHPDTVLTLEDFSAFKANWNPKHENIREIAHELNIGLDSFVFVDDNPAERALVAAQLPEVAVPDIGSDVTFYAEILEKERYFEPTKIVKDDLDRTSYYSANVKRNLEQSRFGNYGEFLISLEMSAEIGAFAPVYLERITQLINKTNQFNLTTRRYTAAEVEAISRSSQHVTLYGRLRDKFGDNGLVSVMIGSIQGDHLEIDLWLMSCRVLKREMEYAMFDSLVARCLDLGIQTIVGRYIPSKKNAMVSGLYPAAGFSQIENANPESGTVWEYTIPAGYVPRTSHILVNGSAAYAAS